MSTNLNLYEKSLIRDISSVVAYAPLSFTDGEYVPMVDSETRLFSGLYIAPDTTAADIVIQGVDGENITLTLGSGYWPFGGAKIIEDGTSISTAAVTVLF